MQLSFLGGADEVTGSKHLLEVNGYRVLLDCGLCQGHRWEAYQKNKELLVEPSKIDALILSHAHIDHSGLIPYYVKSGFKGHIHSTFATRDLCQVMLLDSAYIAEKDAEYISQKLAKNKLKPVPALSTVADVEPALRLFHAVNYNRWFEAVPGVKVCFVDAGHVLGSAIVLLEITEGKRTFRMTFSGDLGRNGLPILRDPTIVEQSDVLIVESTYGNREHEPVANIRENVKKIINDAIGRGGKIIIPAFALERTQEMIYALHQLFEANEIPEIPIYVDSPLATNVTEVFQMHPECYDQEVFQEFLEKQSNPFGFGRLTYVTTKEESMALNGLREPAIIISASGMCEAGRILHHLKNNLEDPRNTILLVGYMVEGTLGYKIQEGLSPVHIFGDPYEIKAKVIKMDEFSAHAGASELRAWIGQIKGLKKVFLVHGEKSAREALGEYIREQLHVPEVNLPVLKDSYQV
ncbi:MBL fold metallo-hydrolase [Candidatus Peregrinibacteria bacterium CG08_land_8_20_14_0_20_41_10]|nr:MAG: MBL fold metallo-hydrolase [Candidatus Peregrinibacteria bacterium CG08_land_8_20_14_0_20_41_10]